MIPLWYRCFCIVTAEKAGFCQRCAGLCRQSDYSRPAHFVNTVVALREEKLYNVSIKMQEEVHAAMHDRSATRAFLLAHCRSYPALEVQDVCKAFYQSVFGCGHLIADPSAAAEYIREEAARCGEWYGPLIEPLDGDFCRVHLASLRCGLSAETLAQLFACSAAVKAGTQAALEERLAVLQEMSDARMLPFDAAQVLRACGSWRSAGFPPLHHSESFRSAYAPAYRVLHKKYAAQLAPLLRPDHL